MWENVALFLFCFGVFFLQSGMCWVKLNVFHLEESLKDLSQKFGNISSNKDYIETFVQMLKEMRYIIGHDLVSCYFTVILII